MKNYLLKYNESATIDLVFYNPETQAFQNTITWASGDIKVIKDGVDAGNATNNPTLVTGRNVWRIVLTASELSAKTISVEFVNTAIVSDTVTIQTFGASGSIVSIPATLASGAIHADELNNIADALLKRDWTGLTGEANRSVLNALRALRNKTSVTGDTLTVTKENDSTTAWTATLITDSLAEPVVSIDPS